jgi:hypothetical protein
VNVSRCETFTTFSQVNVRIAGAQARFRGNAHPLRALSQSRRSTAPDAAACVEPPRYGAPSCRSAAA